MRVAVVDLGTNSTRLLVADVADGRVDELDRRTDITRLGQGVDATGRLSDEAVARVFDVVAGYRESIDRLGVGRTVAVATSAVRDSANGEEFRATLRDRYGIDARTISGDEEARLTFLGATNGREPGPRTVVIDIGGGSTELVVGHAGGAPEFHVSTQAGGVRQTERHLPGDPPSESELAALREEARSIVEAGAPEEVRRGVEAGIAVAGTPTSVAAVDQKLEPYDPEKVDGYTVSLETTERILAMLAALPVAERRKVPGLHPDRAPTIVAGVGILVEAMRAFGLGAVEVREADILHGAALQAAHETGK
jgi:exopolyphosphatase/guanosine-5'-triphosphate,3'-diphosphate pyrophosphatase